MMVNDSSRSTALEVIAQSALRIGYLWKKFSAKTEHRFFLFGRRLDPLIFCPQSVGWQLESLLSPVTPRPPKHPWEGFDSHSAGLGSRALGSRLRPISLNPTHLLASSKQNPFLRAARRLAAAASNANSTRAVAAGQVAPAAKPFKDTVRAILLSRDLHACPYELSLP